MDEQKAFRYFDYSVLIHFIGRFLYNLFIPIMLLKNGYSLTLVLLFMLFSGIVTMPIAYYSQKLMHKRNVIILNIIAIIAEISLLGLFLLDGYNFGIFILLFVLQAFYHSFYYISYYAIITHYSSQKQTGVHFGDLTIYSNISAIVAPIVGAILLGADKRYLILTAGTFLLISLIPLSRIVKEDVNEENLGKIKLKNTISELIDYFMSSGIEFIIFGLWAIYVYLAGYSLIDIGMIYVGLAVTDMLLANYLKTRLNNIGKRRLIIVISASGIMLFSIYRFFLPSQILFTNIGMGIFMLGLTLAVNTETVNKLKGHQTYYSSMLISEVTFFASTLIILLVFMVGLRWIILLPVLPSLILIIKHRIR